MNESMPYETTSHETTSHESASYCAPGPAPTPAPTSGTAAEGPFAVCVLCQEPTEYPESTKGITLCPVCEWQEAERQSCSG
ncbi:hypothetical protein [Streptomyces venezuelae]|nr:hypothetical protein [Streptomyces venezuelae]